MLYRLYAIFLQNCMEKYLEIGMFNVPFRLLIHCSRILFLEVLVWLLSIFLSCCLVLQKSKYLNKLVVSDLSKIKSFGALPFRR
jgi:hypothetical protein